MICILLNIFFFKMCDKELPVIPVKKNKRGEVRINPFLNIYYRELTNL